MWVFDDDDDCSDGGDDDDDCSDVDDSLSHHKNVMEH